MLSLVTFGLGSAQAQHKLGNEVTKMTNLQFRASGIHEDDLSSSPFTGKTTLSGYVQLMKLRMALCHSFASDWSANLNEQLLCFSMSNYLMYNVSVCLLRTIRDTSSSLMVVANCCEFFLVYRKWPFLSKTTWRTFLLNRLILMRFFFQATSLNRMTMLGSPLRYSTSFSFGGDGLLPLTSSIEGLKS